MRCSNQPEPGCGCAFVIGAFRMGGVACSTLLTVFVIPSLVMSAIRTEKRLNETE